MNTTYRKIVEWFLLVRDARKAEAELDRLAHELRTAETEIQRLTQLLRESSKNDQRDAKGRCIQACSTCQITQQDQEGTGMSEPAATYEVTKPAEGTGLQMKYFVLKPAGRNRYAIAARCAMRAYADNIRATNPRLADELLAWAQREMLASVGITKEQSDGNL